MLLHSDHDCDKIFSTFSECYTDNLVQNCILNCFNMYFIVADHIS